MEWGNSNVSIKMIPTESTQENLGKLNGDWMLNSETVNRSMAGACWCWDIQGTSLRKQKHYAQKFAFSISIFFSFDIFGSQYNVLLFTMWKLRNQFKFLIVLKFFHACSVLNSQCLLDVLSREYRESLRVPIYSGTITTSYWMSLVSESHDNDCRSRIRINANILGWQLWDFLNHKWMMLNHIDYDSFLWVNVLFTFPLNRPLSAMGQFW